MKAKDIKVPTIFMQEDNLMNAPKICTNIEQKYVSSTTYHKTQSFSRSLSIN